MLCMGVSASETHSRKNTGMTIAEAASRILAMAREAEEAGRRVQLSVQSAFGCGYEGSVPRERVLDIARGFLDAGFRVISLADTAGHASPETVERMFEALRELGLRAGPAGEGTSEAAFACHFHNTYGLALANCYAAMRSGVRTVETSIGGLGGCPFTKIAGGNACTEDFVHMLQRSGRRMDLDLGRLIALAREIAGFFARELPGTVYRTGAIPA
jgi:hydroxymethylglutaryl-CoA lyase